MVKKIKSGLRIDAQELAYAICSQAGSGFNVNDVEDAIYQLIATCENEPVEESFSRKRAYGRKIKTESHNDAYYNEDEYYSYNYGLKEIQDLAKWLYNHKTYSVLFDDIEQAEEIAEILCFDFDQTVKDHYNTDYIDEFGDSGIEVMKNYIGDNGIMEVLGAYDSSGTEYDWHDNFEKWYGKLY